MPNVTKEEYLKYKEKLQLSRHASAITTKTTAGKEIALHIVGECIEPYKLSFFDSIFTTNGGRGVVIGVALDEQSNEQPEEKLYFWYEGKEGVIAVSDLSKVEAQVSRNKEYYLPEKLKNFIDNIEFYPKSTVKGVEPEEASKKGFHLKSKGFFSSSNSLKDEWSLDDQLENDGLGEKKQDKKLQLN